MSKMREFHADTETPPYLRVWVDGIQKEGIVTSMYAADTPDTEVEGWVECWMLDRNGRHIYGHDDGEEWIASYTLHGKIRWGYIHEN